MDGDQVKGPTRRALDAAALHRVIEGVVRAHGSQGRAARALDISESVLSRTRRGQLKPSKRLLTALGLTHVPSYHITA